ncbi:hypothetical protein TMU01_28440 [Tenuibacillus multivorans]|uniref:3D (Asp-Asp-Asp) domain-containing protein n=1 Tax=Tenuibacillus multivorans TaxID=237069 RepID=A0A1H0B803_9BACI|nr:hypothetical protein TMU01_28440 [Tenuibacillus multivorans]SDN41712.1 3D (Asp-Asp-Asp) domain-containing protein [Tenuibacillus multivorans]
MNKLLFSMISICFILMMFCSPSMAATKTIDENTGEEKHLVQFLSTSKSQLDYKEKLTFMEPKTGQAQTNSYTEEQNGIQQVSETNEGETMYVTATAYTAYCDGCSGTTYTGIDLRNNPDKNVIAVDPDVIPLGSKVWVEGFGTATAADIGGAIKGKRIDIFMPTKKEALRYGVRQVRVKILD